MVRRRRWRVSEVRDHSGRIRLSCRDGCDNPGTLDDLLPVRADSVCADLFGLSIQEEIFCLRELRTTGELMPKKAVFLDRDGTICRDVGYLSTPDGLEVYDFSAPAMRLLRDAGFDIVVITNQSGIGRGLIEIVQLGLIHEKLEAKLSMNGVSIDGIYFCPHRPDEGCKCRKPATGLVTRAAKELDLETSGSWFIGDKAMDIETGIAAGMSTGLVLTGYGESHLRLVRGRVDIVGENLLDVARKILGKSK